MSGNRVKIPPNTREFVKRRDRFTCQYCGKEDKYMTVDHVVPAHQFNGRGYHDRNNLVTSCTSCNRDKGGYIPGVSGQYLPKKCCSKCQGYKPENRETCWKCEHTVRS